jgi:hypothetical protein
MNRSELHAGGYRKDARVYDCRVPRRRIGLIADTPPGPHLIPVIWCDDGEPEQVDWLSIVPTGCFLTPSEMRRALDEARRAGSR